MKIPCGSGASTATATSASFVADVHGVTVVEKFVESDCVVFIFASQLDVADTDGLALRECGWLVARRSPETDGVVDESPGALTHTVVQPPQQRQQQQRRRKSVFQTMYRLSSKMSAAPVSAAATDDRSDRRTVQVCESVTTALSSRMRECVDQVQRTLLSELSRGVVL